MKKIYIIIAYVIFIFLSFLYFSNKFELNEAGFDKKSVVLKNGKSTTINIKKEIKQIKIIFDASKYINTDYIFILKDEQGRELLSEEINSKEFKRNNTYLVDLSKLNLKKGTYKVYMNDYKYYLNNYNDKNYQYQIELCFSNKKNTYFLILYSIISILFLFITFLVVNHKGSKLHILFLKIAFPIFLAYVIFIPMMAGHDETWHFIKAYEISEGVFIPNLRNGYTGAELPKGIDLKLPVDGNFKYSDILQKRNNKIDNKDRLFQSEGAIGVYAPIQFIPQSLGILISRCFTNNTLIVAYTGRIFNMICCILLLSLAIKLMPVAKKVLFLFCLNPLAIEGFTTLSGDGLTVSFSLLFISYVLSLMTKKKNVDKKDIIIMSVLSIFLALCKIVYIVIPFFFFLIPKDKFKNISRKKAILFIIVLPVILNLLWLFIASSISVGSSPFSVPSKSLSLFLSNPFVFIKYFIYSIETYGFTIFFDIFSRRMLMGQVVINNTLVPLSILFTSIYILKDEECSSINFSKKNKILIILLSIVLLLLIYLSIYIFYIPYRTQDLYGIQGRYYFPIISILYVLFSSKIKQRKQKNTNFVLYSTVIIVNLMAIMEIIVQFL